MSLDDARRLAIECGYSDVVEAGAWRGFTVYEPKYPPLREGERPPCVGIPEVILEGNGELRFSDYDETFDYFDEVKLGKRAP